MALEGHKDYELFCEGQRSNATLQRALFPSDAKDSPFNGMFEIEIVKARFNGIALRLPFLTVINGIALRLLF